MAHNSRGDQQLAEDVLTAIRVIDVLVSSKQRSRAVLDFMDIKNIVIRNIEDNKGWESVPIKLLVGCATDSFQLDVVEVIPMHFRTTQSLAFASR